MPRTKGSKNKTPGQRIKEKQNRKPVGRPSKYPNIDLELVEKIASVGTIEIDIAYIIGVDIDTIKEYKKKYKEFSTAIKKGKATANQNVKQKLYHRAIGYEHPEEKIFVTKREPTESDSSEVIVTRVQTTRHYPPDPTSLIFWTINREPDEWKRDRPAKEATVNRIEDFKAIAEILDKRNKKP